MPLATAVTGTSQVCNRALRDVVPLTDEKEFVVIPQGMENL